MMRLMYLPANVAWAFVFGDQIVPMGDFGRFFSRRSYAVQAAREQGLEVDQRGMVKTLEEAS